MVVFVYITTLNKSENSISKLNYPNWGAFTDYRKRQLNCTSATSLVPRLSSKRGRRAWEAGRENNGECLSPSPGGTHGLAAASVGSLRLSLYMWRLGGRIVTNVRSRVRLSAYCKQRKAGREAWVRDKFSYMCCKR